MSSGQPPEGDSPFPSPEMDSVRSRNPPSQASPPSSPRGRRPLALVAVFALVAIGAVSAAAVAFWDGDGGGNPSPPAISTQPTTTDEAPSPR